MLDWRDLPATLAPMLRNSGRNPDARPSARPFVATTNWMDAAKITHALDGYADVVCLCTEPHHFAFVHAGRTYLARDAVIVERDGQRTRDSVPLSRYFRSVTPIGTTVVQRGGLPAITLRLYRGETLVADVPARMP
jgi:hypothetical protein